MRHRDIQQDRFGGEKQAIDVLFEFEDAAVIGANPLKNPVAVQQPVIEHGDLRLLFVDKLSVDIDFHAVHRGQR